jgi:hypothetical protein
VQSGCGGTDWLLWVACGVSSRRLGKVEQINVSLLLWLEVRQLCWKEAGRCQARDWWLRSVPKAGQYSKTSCETHANGCPAMPRLTTWTSGGIDTQA